MPTLYQLKDSISDHKQIESILDYIEVLNANGIGLR